MCSPSGERTTLSNSASLKKSLIGTSAATAIPGRVNSSRIASRYRMDGLSLGGTQRLATGLSSTRRRAHRFDETVEQRRHVMRPRAGLRVSLEAERRRVGQLDALVAAVEQRTV